MVFLNSLSVGYTEYCKDQNNSFDKREEKTKQMNEINGGYTECTEYCASQQRYYLSFFHIYNNLVFLLLIQKYM